MVDLTVKDLKKQVKVSCIEITNKSVKFEINGHRVGLCGSLELAVKFF
jgi:hypothetical protein